MCSQSKALTDFFEYADDIFLSHVLFPMHKIKVHMLDTHEQLGRLSFPDGR